jgi:hypothetical protein
MPVSAEIMGEEIVTCYLLLVTGYWLLVIGHLSFAICHWSFVTGRSASFCLADTIELDITASDK